MEKTSKTYLIVPAWSNQAGQCRIVVRENVPASIDALQSYRDAPNLWKEAGLMNSQGKMVCLNDKEALKKMSLDEPLMAGMQYTFQNDPPLTSDETPKSITLYCTEGSSDKVYQASLQSRDTGWVVEFAYGKRGTALKTGTKTITPVDYKIALNLFDKLVKEKTSKGYTEDQTGVAYTNTEFEHRTSSFLPQLPTAIDPNDLERYLTDPSWGMQEKRDGENRTIRVIDGVVWGINRKGLLVNIPQSWVEQFSVFHNCLISGEAVGEIFYAFDMLECGGYDLRDKSFFSRYEYLEAFVSEPCASGQFDALTRNIQVIPMISLTAAKREALNAIEERGGEGVVFKRLDALFEVGKCRTSLKHKFIESATCIVLRRNIQRSVAVGLRDATGVMIELGNVTIPENFHVPVIGDLVEVRYLYRFEAGCFEQPVYQGQRTDIDELDCTLSQITRIKSKSVLTV